MKPKEKANELVERFKKTHLVLVINSKGNAKNPYKSKVLAKEVRNLRAVNSAIICVDEILNLQNSTGKWLPVVVPDSMQYWNDVKEEIIKIKQ